MITARACGFTYNLTAIYTTDRGAAWRCAVVSLVLTCRALIQYEMPGSATCSCLRCSHSAGPLSTFLQWSWQMWIIKQMHLPRWLG